ncbi:MAG: helix-turn-helix domain-containing protein [Candidatus Izimaplasma sp.]|nr:helix-turn-helix domain-containing protein [Candidatus Izimaplasma bacterium]
MVKNKLKEIREKRNLSQNQLAKITGIDQSQISRFQKGREMRESDIRKFCEALECRADYLLGLVDDEEETNKTG